MRGDGGVDEGEPEIAFLAPLSVVFTVALTFATIELPRVINGVLRPFFPDIYWEPESIEALMRYARPVGYACLALVVALILVGFLTERRGLASLGSFALFLPAFGYFAASMFFLTGIGILRVMWLPFWDTNRILLKLGDIAYLPFLIIAIPLRLLLPFPMAYWASSLVAYLAVGVGLMIFCLGTFTWFYGRSEERGVFDFWIYRHSRHPQYLGFILWSYGVMLLTALAPTPFGGYQPEPSLPWIISTMLVVCVALVEEIAMIRKADEGYLAYRERAPFMLPLPGVVSRVLTAPNRMILKKEYPENVREVLYTFVTYCVILIAISLPLIALNWRIL
jgi:protein-S-isoprenylcysteine O-methyltransferase Ste14